MTLVDLLDVVYAVQVEQHERVALAVVSAGADPSILSEARDRFDAALVEAPEPAVVDSEQFQLRRALGVA